MSYPYPVDGAIPGPNDLLSESQGEIQTNFANIVGWSGVDHIEYGATDSGTHAQVTFTGNNPPSAFPVTSPVLFANIQDGAGNNLPHSVAELFVYSGSEAQSKSQYISQSVGSTLLFGGIILKWGSLPTTNSSVNFASLGLAPFPNNAFAMLVTSTDSALGSPLKVTALSPTAFTVTRSGTGNTGYYFLAIGN